MAPIASSSAAPDNPEPLYAHDYTEGASAIDIANAVASARRSRRNSEFSTYYDYDGEGEGSMFSGPGHAVNPSSVSKMSRIEMGRRSSDMMSRRKSQDLGRGRRRSQSRGSRRSEHQSILTPNGQGDENEAEVFSDDDDISRISFKRRKSTSPTPRAGVFGNIANLFSRQEPDSPPGRRRSFSQSSISRLSRRSRRSIAVSDHTVASDDEEERWGYSSGEEDSEEEFKPGDNASIASSMKQYDSDHNSIEDGNPHLPMLDFDPVFGGEARIDMEMSFTLTEPPPDGPPSRQTIYLADEDSTIRFVGYEAVPWRSLCWKIGCVVTFGILALFGHWFPKLWLRWVAREKAFINSTNGLVVVEVCVQLNHTPLLSEDIQVIL